MANTKSYNGAEIVDSYSLLAFARSHGNPKFCPQQVNKETGEIFDSLAFINKTTDEVTFVSISSKLGTMSSKKVAEMKDDLQVVEFDSGNFMLCKKGQNAWEDIDLF